MHCPKCGSFYAEGAQRFCDTDGVWLVADGGEPFRRDGAGVFSTLLPISTIDPLCTETKDEPRYEIPRHDEFAIDARMESMFLDAEDDPDPHGESEPVFEIINDTPAPGPARKINPYDIPAGHVELIEGVKRIPANQDFDPKDPDGFVGRTVKGRYRIVELVNEDDTGYAYLAEDKLAEDRRVSVRILTNEDLDEVTQSIFAEERVALSHLNHPNIVRLIDSGQFVTGTTFLISEETDALSALDVLQIHGALDPTRTARIIRQAGTALSEAHHEGILHRDLRPEFLLLTTDGESELVKIQDFGVSDGEPNSENLAYKAPEILNGQIPTIATDIYSLGVIAYELLTDHSPFNANAPREMYRRQKAGLAVKASEHQQNLTDDVDALFARVLSLNPLDRPATAREFGDSLNLALAGVRPAKARSATAAPEPAAETTEKEPAKLTAVPKMTDAERSAPGLAAHPTSDDLWTRRSPEPLNEPRAGWLKIAGIGFLALLVIAVGVWYYILNRPTATEFQVPENANTVPSDTQGAPVVADIEVPPNPRKIPQPPNTVFFQTNKQNLRGDLLRNFVGFTLFYPQDWKSGGSKESSAPNTRGKFLDVSKTTPDGKLLEQMLVSYYPSTGHFTEDAPKFPQMVKEANETLKKLIPDYQMVSQGEIKINGGWRAYEIKFQGGAKSETGEKFIVWGRRLFIPAARPGVRNGFEITMLATSFADAVRGVDDVGVKGELANILDTFEPSQSY